MNDYDALGRLTAVHRIIDASTEAVTHYEYDTDDNLRKVTDADGRETNYTFDDFGRLVKVVSPDSGTTRYKYDESGNLTGKKDANGVVTAYEYDAANRLVGVARTDSSTSLTQTESYTYDTCSVGALCSVTDASGVTTYTYDTFGRLSSEARTDGSAKFTLSYGYDALGRLETITYPSGRIIGYSYSATELTSLELDRFRARRR